MPMVNKSKFCLQAVAAVRATYRCPSWVEIGRLSIGLPSAIRAWQELLVGLVRCPEAMA